MVRVTILKPLPDCECQMMDKPIHSEIFDWPFNEEQVIENLVAMAENGLLEGVMLEDYLAGRVKVVVEQLFVMGEKLVD